MTYPQQPPAAPPSAYYAPRSDPTNGPRIMLLLAGIFMSITAGFNLIVGVLWLVAAGGLAVAWQRASAAGTPGGSPANFFTIIVAIYGGLGLGGLAAGSVQTISALKLLRRRLGCPRWGLIGGIASCIDIWCYAGCILPLAFGVYTIVISCMSSVKAYVQYYNNAVVSNTAFPVQAPTAQQPYAPNSVN